MQVMILSEVSVLFFRSSILDLQSERSFSVLDKAYESRKGGREGERERERERAKERDPFAILSPFG